MSKKDLDLNPPQLLAPTPTIRDRLGELPWWAIVLALFLIFAGYRIMTSDQHRDILNFMLDDPHTTTENKFDVVFEVDAEVQIVTETILLKLPDGSRVSINADQVVERQQGTLECDKEANANCLNEFGTLITYQVPLEAAQIEAGVEPTGFLELQGLKRSFGDFIELPDGTVRVVPSEQIISEEEDGTLACNQIVTPGCANLTGNIVTFQQPYQLVDALLARDDVLIRHQDGFEETVRPNRLKDIEVVECEEESPTCHNGVSQRAFFRERVIGTEVGREDGEIRVRTVNEQTEFVAAERILDRSAGLVNCDLEAHPRCQDFEGTIIEREGAIVEGELTLENNRAINVIPTGETTSIEVQKSDIVSEVRNPEDCRVEDEGTCSITVKEENDLVAGVVLKDDSEGVLIQTVAPVFVEIKETAATVIKRSPQECALNNVRGCNSGIWLTLFVTVSSFGLALMIGLVVGLMRVSSNPILQHGSTLYIEIIRGLPLLVLLLVFAFVIGPLIRDTDKVLGIPIGMITQPPYRLLNDLEVQILGEDGYLAEAVLGLAIGYGAFLAEVFRAGIQSISRGQIEAARSLGMSYFQTMRHVVLPQALRIILPPLGNDFIAMLKDSALISVLALPDLLQNGRLYITRTFQPIPVYVVVALLYIVLTMVLSMLVRYMERRMKLP